MILESVEAEALVLPFRFAFKHASFERRATETLWVTARSAEGIRGEGESCPRSYVTGESVTSALAFVARHRDELVAAVHDLSDLAAWTETKRACIDRDPAAWCAVELALLDALARSERRSVEGLLGLEPLAGAFRYSAVVGDVSLGRFQEIVALYRELEMDDFKLKISGSFEDDRAKLAWLEASARRAERVRLDANNLWDDLDEAARYLEALPPVSFAVEEPLAPNRHAELAELAHRLGLVVVLDESFTRLDQLELIAGAPERFVLNLRVSKLGGLLRSLEIARAARRLAIPVIVGAQVGETSLLTRAALPLARAAGEGLLAHEGAIGARLLEVDPVEPALAFGQRGLLPAPRPGAGFGLVSRRRRRS